MDKMVRTNSGTVASHSVGRDSGIKVPWNVVFPEGTYPNYANKMQDPI